MKELIFLSVMFFACGNSDDTPEKLFVKRIQTYDTTVEWYYHSLVGGTTAEIIVIYVGDQMDTVCQATNISDIKLNKNKILEVYFDGPPVKYNKRQNINNNILGVDIIIDSTSVHREYLRTFELN